MENQKDSLRRKSKNFLVKDEHLHISHLKIGAYLLVSILKKSVITKKLLNFLLKNPFDFSYESGNFPVRR